MTNLPPLLLQHPRRPQRRSSPWRDLRQPKFPSEHPLNSMYLYDFKWGTLLWSEETTRDATTAHGSVKLQYNSTLAWKHLVDISASAAAPAL